MEENDDDFGYSDNQIEILSNDFEDPFLDESDFTDFGEVISHYEKLVPFQSG
jgi:hypothetical protein